MQPTYIYRAKIERIIDADTFILMVDLGFYNYSAVKVRLRGFDAVEKNSPKGLDAMVVAESLLRGGQITLQSFKDQHSFDRWVCDVWVDGTPLAHLLRVAGFEKVPT
jgi:endonuclease YncB( thermonuclease family)